MWYLKYFYCKKCFYFPGCETFVCDEVCDALPLENETHNYIHTYIQTLNTNLFQNEIHQHPFFTIDSLPQPVREKNTGNLCENASLTIIFFSIHIITVSKNF